MRYLMRCLFIGVMTLVLVVPVYSGGQAEDAPDGEVELRVLQPGIDQPGLREGTEVIIEEYEAANPNVSIELESIGWGDAYQALTTDFLAGDAPDIIYSGTRWIPAFAAMDALLDMNEYVSEEKTSTFPDGIMQGQYFDDGLYGLPVAFSTKVLYYRTDLIDTPPRTWDELLETAVSVSEEHDDVHGMGIPGASHVGTVQHFSKFLHQAGGAFFDDNGDVALETPEAAEALRFYTELYTEHEVTPNPTEFNREELPTLFGEGSLAMHINGPWARLIMDLDPDNEEAPYATTVLPSHRRSGGLQGGDSLVVWSGTEHPEVAVDFIDFWTSFEQHTEYIRLHGLVPMVEGQAELEDFQDDFWHPFIEMIDDGYPEPQPLAWEPFEEIISDMIQNVLLGELSVEAALESAAQEIRDEEIQPSDI